ncbi:hypothetical protein ACHAP5_010781 [Fusarium lateritium]
MAGSDAAVLEIARKEYQLKSRDHARTPVQWDATPNAGFTTGAPWIRVNDDYETWNAAAQVGTRDSVFEYWRSALTLRKELKNIIVYGGFELMEEVDQENDDVFAYQQSNGGQEVVVVCNFREHEVHWHAAPCRGLELGKVVLSNYPPVDLTQEIFVLRPFEAFVSYWSGEMP